MSTRTVENQKYMEGIKKGDPKVIRSIYKQYEKAILHLVQTNKGSREDAHDVFQEGIMLMYQKSKKSDFQLTSSFSTYFYAVCRNIWSNKSRKKSNSEVTFDNKMLSIIEGLSTTDIEENEEYALYRKKFLELGEDCQKVLDLFLHKTGMKEIMKQMGYGSVSYAKKRKFLCKQKLVQLIKKDPKFKELRKTK